MTVEFPSDRLAMLTDFGISVSFTPVGGVGRNIVGIFDNDYTEMRGGESSSPLITCRSSDVPDSANASVIINAVTYRVMDVQADGTGFTDLVLTRD